MSVIDDHFQMIIDHVNKIKGDLQWDLKNKVSKMKERQRASISVAK